MNRPVRVFLRISTVALGIVTLAATAALAQIISRDLPDRTGVKVGNAIVHAAYTQDEQFDTNIFLTHTSPKFDVITLLNPSVGIEMPFLDNRLSVEYDAGINFFANYPRQDHIDHRVQGLVEINLTDYKITVNDTYRRFTDRSGTENTARIKQQTNGFRAGIAAQFDALGFDVGYNNTIHDYMNNDLVYQSITYEDKSTMTQMVDLTASYRILPKTTILLESDLGLNRYYNSSLSPDSWYTETVVGIKGGWFKKLTLNLRGGIRYQHYDKSSIMSDKPFLGPVIRGGADYRIGKDDFVALALERSVYESTYNNMNYYNVNFIGLEYTHFFTRKISGRLFGAYQINLYPSQSTEGDETAKRWDNFYSGGTALRYDVRKWLSLEGRYEFKRRYSRFSVFDYVDNLITLRGTIGF